MQPAIDHIHITVQNLARAQAFYDAFLPALGFDIALKEQIDEAAHEYAAVEYHHKNLSIAIVAPRPALAQKAPHRRRPGALHHLAFRAQSPAEVDAACTAARAAGAKVLHPPRLWPEYCPDYYAFFCKDSEGNELEVVHFDRPRYFP
ncbi:VOC family protein [Ruminococcaceae bacterium OttesenSCG-928-O06]|nr:VOC family protein [Ruminococcaceae bacterium OttesenSCG-928-O06]